MATPGTREELAGQLVKLFLDKLNLEVPSIETDLMEAGILDSLTLVDLLTEIERAYKIRISIEDLELDSFRTICSIAEFITKMDGKETRDARREETG